MPFLLLLLLTFRHPPMTSSSHRSPDSPIFRTSLIPILLYSLAPSLHPSLPLSSLLLSPSKHTFIIGAQKCTVFGPTGLFQNLTAALCPSAAAAVLWLRAARATFRDTCACNELRVRRGEAPRKRRRVWVRGADMLGKLDGRVAGG